MNRPPRIVIVGASGRLGQALHSRLARDMQVIPLSRPALDLTVPESLDSALEPLDFDHLILPAAMTAVDPCETERELARTVNAIAPGRIAEICARKGATMVHVSTDFVFDGCKPGSYTEEDEPRPASVYGATKREGEERVLAASSNHLVARVAWLYGPGKPAFPEWIVDKAMTESQIALPKDKTGSPTNSTDVAELLVPLIEQRAKGIFHVCNRGSCTWQQWGQTCLDLAREVGLPLRCESIACNTLADIPAFLAPRPANSVMSTAKYTAATGIEPRPWQAALRSHFLSVSSALLEKYPVAACG